MRCSLRWLTKLSVASCLALSVAGCGAAAPAAVVTGDRAFVSEAATATLAVVDLDRGQVDHRIEVGLLPHNLVLSPDGLTLYVTLAGSQAIAVVDTRAGVLLRSMLTAPVPRVRADGSVIQPHVDRDAFSHTTCYDCHRDGGASPRYVGARPLALRLSQDGARLLVAHVNTGELVVLDAATGDRVAATTLAPVGLVKEPTGLELLGGELLVTMRATQPTTVPGLVRRLDPATLAALDDDLPSSPNPVDIKALPAPGLALVTRFDTNLVSILDATGELGRVTVGNGPLGMTALPDGRVLVLDYYGNAISRLDVAARTAQTFALSLGGAPLANPTHAAVGSQPEVAWVVASGADGRLCALDVTSGAVSRAIPIHGLSYDVAVVPGSTLAGSPLAGGSLNR